MAAALDTFEAELKQLRQDFRDGAISRGNYEGAVKDVLTRRGIAQLGPDWWSRYTLEDAPASWVNPHFEYVWAHSPLDRQDVGRMAIALVRELNTSRKIAKYDYLKRKLEEYDVYVPMTAEQYIKGGLKATRVLSAAIMEVFSHTGLYSGGVKELEDGTCVWRYVRDYTQECR